MGRNTDQQLLTSHTKIICLLKEVYNTIYEIFSSAPQTEYHQASEYIQLPLYHCTENTWNKVNMSKHTHTIKYAINIIYCGKLYRANDPDFSISKLTRNAGGEGYQEGEDYQET